MKELAFDLESHQIVFRDTAQTKTGLPKGLMQFQIKELSSFVQQLKFLDHEHYQHIDNGGVTIITKSTKIGGKITHVTLTLEIGYFGYIHIELAETYTVNQYVKMVRQFQNELFNKGSLDKEFFEEMGYSQHKQLEYLTKRAGLPLLTKLELNAQK